MATTPRQSGFFIQSTHGSQGNFELVVPALVGGLAHFWRDNDAPGLPWRGPFFFGSGNVGAISLIQGNFGSPGNLEVVARDGSQLVFYWRLGRPPWTWNGPFPIPGGGGVTGNPSLIQSAHGSRGNFELIVPRAGGGLAHYWRNNDVGSLPWNGPFPFGSGGVSGASLVQGNFGSPGNLEVVACQSNQLVFYWRLGNPPWTWNGPFPIPGGGGVTGNPSLIQSSHGTRGNFEVVVPRVGGGLAHYWRNNDATGLPWNGPFPFGRGNVTAVSLFQGNFGSPGNLEVIAIEDGRLAFYWRLGRPPWTWNGPFYVAEECVRLHVKILTNPNISIANMLASMRQVYATARLRVDQITTENLNLPELNDLDVGACAGGTTAEQDQLFANRNNVGANDIVVYFVRSTVPPYNGCASFPAGRPGAVVAQGATTWTLAHEVGHVLGLSHVNNNDRLMTGNGTGSITNPPPDLVVSEVNTMRVSNLTVVC